jgi:hypothetical protein
MTSPRPFRRSNSIRTAAQRVVLIDKVRAGELLIRMTQAADGLPLDDREQGHGRWH